MEIRGEEQEFGIFGNGFQFSEDDSSNEDDEWMEDEFYLDGKDAKRRRRRRQKARDEATYGVFGGDRDASPTGERRDVSYSKPVGFVGAGTIGNEEQYEERVGLGVRHGWSNGEDDAGTQSPSGVQQDFEEGGSGDDGGTLPSEFGKKIRKAAVERRKRYEAARKGLPVHAPKPQQPRPPRASSIGQFEAHTKGIGAKLLAKMGWKQGSGLGKEGKGLAEPLEAKLRPKGQGMGYGDRREPSLAPVTASVNLQKDKKKIDQVTDVSQEAQAWRKKRVDRNLKESKQIYKTVDDVLAESKGAKSTVQTIIDMRGPQTKILKDLEELKDEDIDAHAGEGMPELQHNMRLLVDMTEVEIRKIDGRIRHSRDTETLLQKENIRLTTELEKSKESMSLLESALAAARGALNAASNGATLSEVRAIFSAAKANLGVDYVPFEMHILALAVALPLLKQWLQTWSPLADPTGALSEFSDWKPLLERENVRPIVNPDQDVHVDELFASSDPYERLVLELVLPPLRKELVQTWDPKDTMMLEEFVESWEPILPSSVILYVMQHLVLPKLQSAVQAWDPLHDPIAPHTWLHPWLPYLGCHMNELWPIVRFKFSSALTQWHPSDSSALELLRPWRKVFKYTDWEQLCSKSIEPKLCKVLDTLKINPADQQMDPYDWVMAWASEISPDRLAKILDIHFFPKWRTVLRHWLTRKEADFDEIARWYLAWKSCIPDEVLESRDVDKHIQAALHDMNAAVSGEPIEPTWTPPPSQDSAPGPQFKKLKVSERTHLSLKDLIEQFAEESGVEFLPKPGRMHEGFQVYHFGLVSCIVDSAHETIMAQMNTKSHTAWRIVSLDELLEENDRRLRGRK